MGLLEADSEIGQTYYNWWQRWYFLLIPRTLGTQPGNSDFRRKYTTGIRTCELLEI
jgi:hypothetical protein